MVSALQRIRVRISSDYFVIKRHGQTAAVRADRSQHRETN